MHDGYRQGGTGETIGGHDRCYVGRAHEIRDAGNHDGNFMVTLEDTLDTDMSFKKKARE